MASVWTIKPETRKIELSYVDPESGNTFGFWIAVKKYLTVGEQRRQMTAGWKGLQNERQGEGATISIDWQTQSFARTEAYLVDWSLADDKDKKLPLTREGIEALNEDVYKLIEDAITEHIKAVDQEKKARTGRSEPSATSD